MQGPEGPRCRFKLTIVGDYYSLGSMARAFTEHYDEVISRLIDAGHFANRSEVVRAGLRKLEQEYLGGDYLHPPPLPRGTLARTYRRQSNQERDEERRAARASRKPRPEE